MKYKNNIYLLREVIKLILESESKEELGVCIDKLSDSAGKKTFACTAYDIGFIRDICKFGTSAYKPGINVDNLDEMDWVKNHESFSKFNNEFQDICDQSVVSYIELFEPSEYIGGGSCDDAYMVYKVAGRGDVAYCMGYYASPSGKLMIARYSVSPEAQEKWLTYYKSKKYSYSRALDNKDHPKKGEDPFHDKHHTPKDDSDDCETWHVGKENVENQDVSDAMNYVLGSPKGSKYNFAELERKSNELIEKLVNNNNFNLEEKYFTHSLQFAGRNFFDAQYDRPFKSRL